AQAIDQQGPCQRAQVEPEEMDAAQNERQQKVEQQNRAQPEHGPGQGKTSVSVLDEFVGDQQYCQPQRPQQREDMAGALDIENEERAEQAPEQELQREV